MHYDDNIRYQVQILPHDLKRLKMNKTLSTSLNHQIDEMTMTKENNTFLIKINKSHFVESTPFSYVNVITMYNMSK